MQPQRAPRARRVGPPKSKRERFLEIGKRRVERVIGDLRRLGNCANRSSYEYEEPEIAAMRITVQRRVDEVFAKFKGKEESQDGFEFPKGPF